MLEATPAGIDPRHMVVTLLGIASIGPGLVAISPSLVSCVLSFVTQVLATTGGPISLQHQLIGGGEQAIGPIVLLVPGLNLGFGPLVPTVPFALPRLASGSVVPVAVLLDISGELEAALAFPPWTGTVVKFAGLCMLLLGVMAWLSSTRSPRRLWGRRIATSGAGLTIVGFAFDTFINVVEYVLTG